MASVIIEDQDPIMRRAKIRASVATVLLCIVLGSLLKISHDQRATPDAKITVTAPANVAPPAPPRLPTTARQEEVKAPVAPPEPVYQSFTAEPPTPVAESTATATQAPVVTEPAKKEDAVVVEAPPAPPKAESKIITTSTGSYILQAGVFGDMGNARKQLEKLSSGDIPAQSATKLWIGPFATEQDAATAREAIQAAGLGVPLQDNAVSSAKGLMLVGGIHESMEHATALRNSLTEKGFPARTETRVLVGPFDSKENADKARNKIKKLGISVVLMRS